MNKKELLANLKDKKWRLNNLYFVKDEDGITVKFKLRPIQEFLLDNLHTLNVILKARQLGVTTFFAINYLDDVIFNGLNAGLIAHTMDAAEKIFDDKIRFAWDRLPESIKGLYIVDTKNAKELRLIREDTKSSIYVNTSFRSGTLQRLHVSELSTIDQTRPDKSQEIKTGAFNTVHEGSIVTVESTAKEANGVFYDMCMKALNRKKMNKKTTMMDWKLFFFPWYEDKKYSLHESVDIPKEYQKYFDSLEINLGIKLTKGQKAWYYKKSDMMETTDDVNNVDMKSEFPSTEEEAFEVTTRGAYYKRQMDKIMEQGRVRIVPYEEGLPVNTYWDLGTSAQKKDATSIVFAQEIGTEIHIIDFYGNNSEGLAHYVKVLQNKGYVYGRHYAPHDIQVKELGTGKTRLEIARGLGLNFDVVPKLDFLDGIEATRFILGKCWFDEQNASELLGALRAYRKDWDSKKGCYRNRPLDNWCCDSCDAMRMLAITIRENRHFKDEEYKQHGNGNGYDVLNPLSF